MKGKLAALALILLLFSCNANRANANNIASKGKNMKASDITTETKIRDIISNPSLGDWGRLLFPVNAGYYSGDTLGDLQLIWYSHINPQKTVEIVRYVTECAENDEQVFFDIYSEEEKRTDPDKRNTGLFFFRGKPGAKTAICNAGGGFAYVGAMHDSFPHALELSKKRLQRIRSDLQARSTNRLPRFSACNRLSPQKRRKARNRHEGLLPLGRKCRSKNGSLARLTGNRILWRTVVSSTRCCHHAIHRSW